MEREVKVSEKQSVECPHCETRFTISVRVEAEPSKEPVRSAPDKVGRPSRSGVTIPSPLLPLDYKKVVVAVEGEGTREVIRELLEESQFEIIDASSADDIFSVLEQCYPATVLVDFGISKITLMNIEEAINKATLIVVSAGYGKNNIYSEEHASLLGADDYIERRHIKRDLINKVKLHLRRKGLEETPLALGVGDPPPLVSVETSIADVAEANVEKETPVLDQASAIIEHEMYVIEEAESALIEPEPVVKIGEHEGEAELAWAIEQTPLMVEEPSAEVVEANIEEAFPVPEETSVITGYEMYATEEAESALIAPEPVIEIGEHEGESELAWAMEQTPALEEAISEVLEVPIVEEAPVLDQEPIITDYEMYATEDTGSAFIETEPVVEIGEHGEASELAWAIEQPPLVVEAPVAEVAEANVVEETPVFEQEPVMTGYEMYGTEEAESGLIETEPVVEIGEHEGASERAWAIEQIPLVEAPVAEVAEANIAEEIPVLEQASVITGYEMYATEEVCPALIEPEPAVEIGVPEETFEPTVAIEQPASIVAAPVAEVAEADVVEETPVLEQKQAPVITGYEMYATEEVGSVLIEPKPVVEIVPTSKASVPIHETKFPSFPIVEVDLKELELAKRLARIIVSDIVLYNENKVVEGIRNNTFYTLLKDDIEEGRKHYHSRVSTKIQEQGDHLLEAFEAFIKRKKVRLT